MAKYSVVTSNDGIRHGGTGGNGFNDVIFHDGRVTHFIRSNHATLIHAVAFPYTAYIEAYSDDSDPGQKFYYDISKKFLLTQDNHCITRDEASAQLELARYVNDRVLS